MRIAVAILGALACAALAPVALAADVAESQRAESQRRVLDYWTPERIAEVATATGVSDGTAATTLKKKKTPKKAPRKSYVSQRVPDATSRPFIASGKIFGHTRGAAANEGYECSGTVVQSANHSVVITAGHCLNFNGQFADKLIFIPGFRNGKQPYGQWVFDRLLVPGGYPPTASPAIDYGAATMAPQVDTDMAVEDAVGARKIRTDTKRRQTYRALGYPHNKGKGERLWSCRSKPLVEINGPDKYPPVGIGCDMSFGASGGGWIGDSGAVVSVTSIGIEGYKNYVFGPRLRTAAKKLLDQAGEN
ncbi:MAG: hypothetical protein QOG62_2152 [Thermoleophilaceae bacterium]|nr:hypothetical protein [Thermoleophilaceae bacterium]